MMNIRARFAARLGRFLGSDALAGPEMHAEAAEAALYALTARLRPDLGIDEAAVEVEVTLADFVARLDARDEVTDAEARARRDLFRLLVAAAAVSAGPAIERAVAFLATHADAASAALGLVA